METIKRLQIIDLFIKYDYEHNIIQSHSLLAINLTQHHDKSATSERKCRYRVFISFHVMLISAGTAPVTKSIVNEPHNPMVARDFTGQINHKIRRNKQGHKNSQGCTLLINVLPTGPGLIYNFFILPLA